MARTTSVSNKWKRRAEALGRQIPLASLHRDAVAAAENSRPEASAWAVAFSGGPDSLALLLLIWAHWPQRRRRLIALHFDHRLRGKESRADAKFCRDVAGALGIELVQGTWGGRGELSIRRERRGGRGPASEAQARAARLEFFRRAGRRAGVSVLWLGHHCDDIIESQLMRLARGSGTAGLAAPRPVAPVRGEAVRLRPLLTLSKAQITAALASETIPFRVDASNRAPVYFRNRLRERVVPGWKRAAEGRDALAGAARSRELLQEDDDALEAWADRVGSPTPGGKLNLARLRGAPRAVWRRALHRWLLAQDRGERRRKPSNKQKSLFASISLSRAGFEALLDAIQRGKISRFSLGTHRFARIARKWLSQEWARNARGD